MNNNKLPESIKNLGVMALSGTPSNERLQRGLERLNQLGANIVLPEQREGKTRFLAAPDNERARQLHELLLNPEIDAIIAKRGGFGAARILDIIDWELVRSRNIPIIGYSDVSAFHLAALKHGCRNQIHGPMIASEFGTDFEKPGNQDAFDKTLDSLVKVIEGNDDLLPEGTQLQVIKPGKAVGPLIPTNLTLLASLIGTPYFPSLNNAILAIEDVNEAAYKIDGYLTHLRNAGHLKGLAGLIYGAFTDGEDAEYLPEVLQDFAKDINGPVVQGLPFGHIFPTISLPVGKEAFLDATVNPPTLRLAPEARFESHIATTDEGTLNYRFLQPKNQQPGKQYPLVLFLHGAGERGEDNHIQLIHVVKKFLDEQIAEQYPCFVLVPQCPEGQQWVNTPWGIHKHDLPTNMSKPLAAVNQLLDEMLLNYPIDPSRIYLMGISMGGYGTWDLAMRTPQRFAAAVPICGGGDPNHAKKLKGLPIWAFHGDSDTAVPTSRSRDMIQALKDIGEKPIYTELKNTGHDAWTPAINNPELIQWLFKQHK
ncbi:MAG: hypothetical protein GX561_02205 [Lentisphaerae bacterium]|jgi:muramoyltetrapeptide carboxypeptidase LdcA involved in peptidoglycan recycling/predicted esterase|nr:hypothetical protein [Lentisphaerota bacterium]